VGRKVGRKVAVDYSVNSINIELDKNARRMRL